MRIGFIVPYLYRFQRGIESSACCLASALAEDGHAVTILTWAQRPRSSQPVLSPLVEVRSVPYFRYFRERIAAPFYRSYLRKGRFDLLNIYFADCGEANAIRKTKRSLGYRVQFIAGYPPDLVPHRYEAFDRLGITSLVDRVVAKSPAMVEGIAGRMGRPTVMIPNGVDIGYFAPDSFPREECRRALGIGATENLIVSVAALEERKGLQYLLRALPSLLGQGRKVKYLIAGVGSFQTQLEIESAKLGVEDAVRFLGNVEDVRPVLGAADVFSLLSRGEGFPNALLEAWAMDLPALVSQHPPYPDIVSDQLGLLVNETDTGSVVRALEQLLASDLSERGTRRTHVANRYRWSRIATEIIQQESD
ncbi:MAG: glycosyltransferase family 4 protein [Opitutaceae bacterium]